ncbi:Zn-ribbon domain-containing OB-fold protein [Pseudonocardia lutea]|uniref:Zn-ribbon domain-containing OB-fold protein n=1 Tax=Pseudonocardia lutea TaxID=2172015 RepID=A0ABW1I5Q6_9PSEU
MTTHPQLGPWIHRPLVAVDPDQVPFWDGLKKHEFHLCRCRLCGRDWFPFTVCRDHDDIPRIDDMEWVATSGRGKVFATTVVHQVIDADFLDEVPYVLAIIELDEGPLFPARLVECDPDAISIDDRVEVVYVDSDAGHTLPLFRPEPL